MRIAHLSDLHLSPDHFPERTDAFYEILQKCRSLKTDHIVITGDITNQAKPKEFAHARNILKEFGLLDPAKLTVTVGNHDIFGGPFYAEDVLSFPGYCRQTDYESKVKEFYTAFRESFEGCKYVSGASIFPFVKVLRDVVFVGINSVAQWSMLKNPIGSNGEIGKQQLHRLKEIFFSDMLKGKTIFVLIHHHFHKQEQKKSAGNLERLWQTIETTTMKLWKKKRLFHVFEKAGIARVLHGHLHHHEEYKRKNIEFLNAGGTMFANSHGDRLFHLLHIQKKGIDKINISISPQTPMQNTILSKVK